MCLFALCCGVATAQIPTGTITGKVVDTSGAFLVDVVVQARASATNSTRQASTGTSGAFTITTLRPGEYEVTVTREGFRPLRRQGVLLDVNGVTQLNLVMEVGPVAQTVDVSGKTATLDADELNHLSELLTFAELMTLVQDERTITDMAYLIAGVGRRARGGLGSGFVIGGARADNTNFIVDGFSDYDPRTGGQETPPNYDAVDEFRIQTTGSVAEYGHMAGGVMNIVLRSGTDRLHGSAFEFYRGDRLAARNFFDAHKSGLLRNQFGATLSGPLPVSRIYRSTNKTFFLVSWESLHQDSGENRLSEVPTAAERAGDFSRSLTAAAQPVALIDPLSGAPFPQKRVPISRLAPIAQQVAGYYPLANSADPTDNYHAYVLNRTHFQSFVLKVEEYVTAKDTVAFRYLTRLNASESPYSGSDLGLFGAKVRSRPTLAGVNYTHIINPSTANEFRAGVTRMSDHEASVYSGQDINSRVGLPAVGDPHLYGFPRFSILNLAALGDSTSMPLDFTKNSYEAADAVTRVHGRHVLKFGADILRTQYFPRFYSNTRGTYSFLGRWSGVPFADFLLGEPDSTSRQQTGTPAYWFYTDLGLFVQDQYEIASRLTLSFGLRYERMPPPIEKYGRSSSFAPELGKLVIADGRVIPDLTQRIAAAGLTGLVTTAQQAKLPSSLEYSNNLDFAPRFGFSFGPFGSGETVIRGGYGIYFADSLANPIFNDLSNVYPFTVSQTFNRVAAKPTALTLQNPFPANLAVLPGVTNVAGFNLRPDPQYLQGYNLSVEHRLAPDLVIEMEYAGSHGSHLERQYDLNQPFRVASQAIPAGSFPRPFAGFGTINYYDFGSNSVYNSGSVLLRRSYRKGLFFGLSYIFSKSIDDASQVSGNSQGDYPGAQDSRNLAAERGRSDWDTRHAFYLFGSYALPFRGSAWSRGWQVSLTGRFYSGQPFTPRVANANLNQGEANRPDRIASGSLADFSVARWFDIAAFPTVPSGAFRFGNSGRNILGGPTSASFNVAVMRNLRRRDRLTVQFRCEAMNVLNHANFGLPVNFVDAQNAGQILNADPGRIVQMGMRVQF